MMAISTRKCIFSISKGAFLSENRGLFTRVSSSNYSSKPFEGKVDAEELFKPGAEGESHKDNESVFEVGNRIHEITEKIKENAQETMEKTGKKIEEVTGHNPTKSSSSSSSSEDENDQEGDQNQSSILEGPDDENRLKKKLEKERGGKPVDEVEGLDVNWRPIDENKTPSN